MPIFEFSCNECSKKFDKLCPSNYLIDDIICPSCGKNKPQKLLSLFGYSSKDNSGGTTSSSASGCGSCSSTHCSSCR